MKIALINDSHFGKSNGKPEVLAQQRKFFNELFFPYLKKNNISKIFHLGDLLDNRKSLSPLVLYEMRKIFLEPLRENGIHMTVLIGNHDVYFKNTNKVSGLKEALGFFTNNISIVQEPYEETLDGTTFLWIPWMNEENEKSSVATIKRSTRADVLLGHFEFSGFPMDKTTISRGGQEYNQTVFSKFSHVLSGHYHHKSTTDNIYYLGSQYEMTWSDYNDPKYFHVFDTKEKILTPVRNPNTLFSTFEYRTDDIDVDSLSEEAFRDKIIRCFCYDKKDLYKFDRCISRIESFSPYSLDIVDYSIELAVDEEIKEMHLDTLSWSDTLHFSKKYIDEKLNVSNTNLEKEILTRHFEEIYREAELID